MSKIKVRGKDEEVNLGTLDVAFTTFDRFPHITESIKYATTMIMRYAPKDVHDAAILRLIETLELIETVQ